MNRSDIPNLISFLRIMMVVPIVMLLFREAYGTALSLFLIAGVSDGLDGYLAKRYGWTSRLGSILDPLADKALLVGCYVALGWMDHIPLWLVFAVVGRDVIIVAGAFAFYALIGRREVIPSWMSKVNTFAQIVLGLTVVLSLAWYPLPERLLNAMFQIVLVTTVMSGADYVWTWSRRALSERRLKS